MATMEEMEACVRDIITCWKQNHIQEIDFIPITEPPYIVYAENTLGISMKIIKSLYLCVYQQFLALLALRNSQGGSPTDSEELQENLLEVSLAVLTIKGDFPMAYNIRKDILSRSASMEILGAEVQRLHTLFTKHPKSPSAWEHLRWCYQQRNKLRNRTNILDGEIETEKEVCRSSAERYPKNYYAWMHRLWLLRQMNTMQIDEELFFTQQWLWSHTSDHSAVNHRLQVIQHVMRTPIALQYIFSEEGILKPVIAQYEDLRILPLEEEEKVVIFLDFLLQESRRTLHDRPGAESLWIQHRQLFSLANDKLQLLSVDISTSQLLDKYICQTYSLPIKSKEAVPESVKDVLFKQELRALSTLLLEIPLWAAQKQRYFAEQHVKFLQRLPDIPESSKEPLQDLVRSIEPR